MKDNELKSILSGCDETIVPDKALVETTAARMKAATVHRPKRMTVRALLVAAAIALCTILMIGAGYKVFEYIYYLPGKGIVMDDGSVAVSVLERAVRYDEIIYIEACSLEKSDNGTNRLTIITNNPYSIPFTGALGNTVTAEVGDESYTLELIKAKSGTGISYYVCNDFPDVSVFSIGNTEIALTPIDATKFASVEYPTVHGITFIAFPLSEGSSMIAYTVQYTPEDDGTVLPELAELSQVVSADLYQEYNFSDIKVTVTDVLGGTYRVIGLSGSNEGEKSDSEGYLNGEHIIALDRRLEADVASISVDTIAMEFYRPKLVEKFTITVPEYGETIEYSEPFINRLGFYDSPSRLSFVGTDTGDMLILYFDKPAACDINYVSRAQPVYALYTEDELNSVLYGTRLFAGFNVSYGSKSDKSTGLFERTYSKTIDYPKCSFTAGDSIIVELYSLILEVSGNWTINFN